MPWTVFFPAIDKRKIQYQNGRNTLIFTQPSTDKRKVFSFQETFKMFSLSGQF